jgi:hypothetical protein
VIVGCGEPAGQLIGSDERDGGDRHHEVSILIASCLMVGRGAARSLPRTSR